MSDNKDAVLYSLSELKDMPPSEVAENAQASQGGANIKRTPTRSSNWASDDDASDLLAGILNETSRSAEHEELERSRKLMALKREASGKQSESARKREEGERRMAAEMARREEADRRRRALLREIEGPSPEEIEAERLAAEEARQQAEMEEKLKEAERARLEAERRAAQAAREQRAQEQQRLEALAAGQGASKAKTAGFGIAAVALMFFVMMVLVGGGVGAWFAFQPEQTPEQTFRRAAITPASSTSTSVEKEFLAMATPAPTEALDEAPAAAGKKAGKAKRRTKGRRGLAAASARKSKAGKKAKAGKKGKKGSGRKFNFGASKGKIVF